MSENKRRQGLGRTNYKGLGMGVDLVLGGLLGWISNAAVNVKLIGDTAYAETPAMWLWFAVFLVQLAAAALLMLRGMPVRKRPDADESLQAVPAADVRLARQS